MEKNKIFYKTEGNIIYPDKNMLTWGPFYYHSAKKAKERMKPILKDIVDWCNMKDPTLNISPTNMIEPKDGSQIVFRIKAWKDKNTLQECNGIITVDTISFDD